MTTSIQNKFSRTSEETIAEDLIAEHKKTNYSSLHEIRIGTVMDQYGWSESGLFNSPLRSSREKRVQKAIDIALVFAKLELTKEISKKALSDETQDITTTEYKLFTKTELEVFKQYPNINILNKTQWDNYIESYAPWLGAVKWVIPPKASRPCEPAFTNEEMQKFIRKGFITKHHLENKTRQITSQEEAQKPREIFEARPYNYYENKPQFSINS